MFLCVVALALALVAGRADCSAEADEHQLELKRHYDHLAFIADFPCHEPQPRVVPAAHIFTDILDRAYFPDVTVLHRCDAAAGCCTGDRRCAPAHTDTLRLPFKVTFLEGRDGHKKGSWTMMTAELVNHTACHCAPPPPPAPPRVDQPFCAHLQESCGALSDSCASLQTSCRAYVIDQEHHEHAQEHELGEAQLHESISEAANMDKHHGSGHSDPVKGSSKKTS